MDIQNKTKEELISELQKLSQEYNSLKVLMENQKAEFLNANKELLFQNEGYKQLNIELQKSKENEEKSELKLIEAQELAHIGYWELDLLSNKLTWSDEIFRIFGCNPQEFGATYEAFLNFIHLDDTDFVNTSYLNHINSKIPYNIVHRLLLSNNERKQTEKELIEAKEKAEESDKLKTAFINNISHEVRTPLNGILGFSGFLAKEDLSPEEKTEMLAHVQHSSDRLMNTIVDYMDMAMIVSGSIKVHLKQFSLNQIFKEQKGIAEQLCAEKNIKFIAELPSESGDIAIQSDPELVKKILSKLMDNAIKFTHKGSITFGYEIKTGMVEFYLRDTGVGIDSHKLELIFNKFSQADTSMTRGYEGSGLGLTIGKGIATLLGGEILVASEEGKGSEFKLLLPADKYSKPLTTHKTDANNQINKQNPTILIAEDDELNYLYVETILKELRCKIIHAINGAEAVNYCKQNNGISIVLMDIKMPVMNGIEAAQQIREFMPELPIIATTAYAQTGDEHRFLSAGMNEYVAKPINKEKLLSLIRNYIE